MNDTIDRRLKELRKKAESGQKMIAELVHRKKELEQTLLRIEGAMQVLEELKAVPEPVMDISTANGSS